MFADMELLGIPYQIVVGGRSLEKGMLEYKMRHEGTNHEIAVEKIVEFIKQQLSGNAS